MYLPSISFFHLVFLSFSLHYLLTSYYSFSILFCPPFSFSLYFNFATYPLRFHCLTLIISTQVKERKGRNSGEMEETNLFLFPLWSLVTFYYLYLSRFLQLLHLLTLVPMLQLFLYTMTSIANIIIAAVQKLNLMDPA